MKMTRLYSTIQKETSLNMILFENTPEAKSNGIHNYVVKPINGKRKDPVQAINFQNGPRKEKNSIHGVTDSDLLEIVRHRLEQFQSGEFACDENAKALEKTTEALMWLSKRANDRASRGVLGKKQK